MNEWTNERIHKQIKTEINNGIENKNEEQLWNEINK